MQTSSLVAASLPATPPPAPSPSSSVRSALERRSFAVMATTSPKGRPHAAGVLYKVVDNGVWINTLRSSRKAKNIAANHHVGLTVPVRRVPVGPPSTIMFQATATIVALDSPAVKALCADGRLKSLTSHGELELADGCFVRIALPRRLRTGSSCCGHRRP